ncbi:MAG: translation initiation factor IF-3 [Saprospiraceae bacterium]|nr:translation initiation factor IF-3 [Saprospiraceae bacterium]
MNKRQRSNSSKSDNFSYRINREIHVPEIRLVGENFEELSETIGQDIETGIFRTRVALDWAQEMGLDLVEISPTAKPPVCKIIDYRKFIYDKKKKDKEIKARTVKTVIKEIRFGPNTDDHDFEFKLKHAKKFLEEGAKVRAFVQFRGRAIVFKDRGELLLLRFLKELEDFGSAEELPKLEGRRMSVIVSPKKRK